MTNHEIFEVTFQETTSQNESRAHPEVKIFKFNQIEKAQDWILK